HPPTVANAVRQRAPGRARRQASPAGGGTQPMQLKPIAEQVVAVMGASSGIGRETALRAAARGAKVVVAARSEPGLHSLVGEIRGAKAALPQLKRAGGALIHVSSIEARRAFPLHSAYGAAKHGVDGFVEALRVELRHEGAPVSVTQILPASVNTPLFNKA